MASQRSASRGSGQWGMKRSRIELVARAKAAWRAFWRERPNPMDFDFREMVDSITATSGRIIGESGNKFQQGATSTSP